MTEPVPTIGRIVHYTLSNQDAENINRRRGHGATHIDEHRANSNGVIVHTGNDVKGGDVYPMIITRVWGDQPDSHVNGQVFLDGNDLFWVTSASVGEGEWHFTWPVRT